MASLRKLGFYWGEDKITLVEFDKNAPQQIFSAPLGTKANTSSPFSSNLTEEIQITALLKKMLQDNNINDGSFCVSLPMKDIILRSFVIPFVKPNDIQNVIKFESKRYLPFDIQDLSYVSHTFPFAEGQTKKLQVIFLAVRKEVLARYDRIFKQVNIAASYSEPYIVSLSKALLFRKDIKPTEHIAFLFLDQNLGHICFINKGIPQFIREFSTISPSQLEETNDSKDALNAKIVNEVGNSFDFYGRQFTGDRVEQVLVSSDFIQKELLDTLEAELKLKITKFSPAINTPGKSQSTGMDAVYAMGVCVVPPVESLSKLNFVEEKASNPALENSVIEKLKPYKEIIFALLIFVFLLLGVYSFFRAQLNLVKINYDQLTATEGINLKETQDSLQTEIQQNVDKINQYKNIRTKSDMTAVILKVASHVPKGTLLNVFRISYPQNDMHSTHVNIDIQGTVTNGSSSEQIVTVNRIYTDFKNDKELAKFIDTVTLGSLSRKTYNDKQVTGFDIHFS